VHRLPISSRFLRREQRQREPPPCFLARPDRQHHTRRNPVPVQLSQSHARQSRLFALEPHYTKSYFPFLLFVFILPVSLLHCTISVLYFRLGSQDFLVQSSSGVLPVLWHRHHLFDGRTLDGHPSDLGLLGGGDEAHLFPRFFLSMRESWTGQRKNACNLCACRSGIQTYFEAPDNPIRKIRRRSSIRTT